VKETAMKTITLVRHAKSSWKDRSLQDLDRPLNRRGLTNAVMMAERLLARGAVPTKLYSSPATRARETAALFSGVFGLSTDTIESIPTLYTFNYEDLLGWMRSLGRDDDNLQLVCHNPAITDLVNFLTLSHIEKIPTCGVAVLQLNISCWQQLGAGVATMVFYDYPKNDIKTAC
jgi:phosphohistidine phosphatase